MDLFNSIASAYTGHTGLVPEILPYAILALNYVIFQLLRSLTNRIFAQIITENKSTTKDRSPQQQSRSSNKWLLILRLFINELISTCELCADCAELNVVYEKHGSLAYGTALFVLTYVWIETFEDAHTTPGYLFEDYVWQDGNTMLKSSNTYARFIGQSLAMPIAWRLATVYWKFQLINEHRSMLSMMSLIDSGSGLDFDGKQAYESGSFISLAKQYKCKTSLNTTPVYGFLIELICCMLCRLVELIGQKLLEQNQIGRRLFSVLCSFICSLLVVMALELSGGYFNPILASSLEYGCQGIDFYQHALVFWLGPLAGHVLARGVYKRYVSAEGKSPEPMIDQSHKDQQRPVAAIKPTITSTRSKASNTRSAANKSVHYELNNKLEQTGTNQRSSGSNRSRRRHN